ncbi:MAG: hypothetical protein IPK85_00515 [Gemmatimonadetes bacterium]|nr:hypothetical protein [Gemmatimonadota bacterium]
MSAAKVERWAQVESIFVRAVELRAEERGAFVAASLRRRRDAAARSLDLLAGHDSAGGDAYPDRLLTPSGHLPSDGRITGSRLGPWAIDELIGRGGMGDVYRAHRADARV